MATAKKRAAKAKGTWGGARPGAGRKKVVPGEESGELDPLPTLGDAKGHSDITEEARKMGILALQSLGRVAASTKARHSDRIKAAVEILTWGYGKPLGILTPPARVPSADAGPKEPEIGKKEQIQRAAENPDTSTLMGKLIAKRAGLKVVGDE